jgi:hypothetical protein
LYEKRSRKVLFRGRKKGRRKTGREEGRKVIHHALRYVGIRHVSWELFLPIPLTSFS